MGKKDKKPKKVSLEKQPERVPQPSDNFLSPQELLAKSERYQKTAREYRAISLIAFLAGGAGLTLTGVLYSLSEGSLRSEKEVEALTVLGGGLSTLLVGIGATVGVGGARNERRANRYADLARTTQDQIVHALDAQATIATGWLVLREGGMNPAIYEDPNNSDAVQRIIVTAQDMPEVLGMQGVDLVKLREIAPLNPSDDRPGQ